MSKNVAISAHIIGAVLSRMIEGNGRRESARRMRSVLGCAFKYAKQTGRTRDNLAADLRGAIAAPRVTHIVAITRRHPDRQPSIESISILPHKSDKG